ncbi:hypothetical protein R6Q57_009856 [Mikania cordata]
MRKMKNDDEKVLNRNNSFLYFLSSLSHLSPNNNEHISFKSTESHLQLSSSSQIKSSLLATNSVIIFTKFFTITGFEAAPTPITLTTTVSNADFALKLSLFNNFSISLFQEKPPPTAANLLSARTKHAQHESERIQQFENISHRDDHFIKTKDFLCKQPQQILRLDDAGKLYRELGFPRGRKVLKFIQRHPLVFPTYRHSNDKFWLGFNKCEKLPTLF